jgi:GDP-L-fucose synthase
LIRKCIEAQEKTQTICGVGRWLADPGVHLCDRCCPGIALATERYNESLPVNIGSGFEISIKDLAEKIARMTGFEGDLVWDTSKPNGQPRGHWISAGPRRNLGLKPKRILMKACSRPLIGIVQPKVTV